jgi:signal transduction histidine kinase
VRRGNKTFVIGAGFYPESDGFAVQQLVQRAVNYAENNSAKALFPRVNSPEGVFVQGDIYLWVFSFEGNVYAHGNNQAIVGRNQINWQDSNGKYRNQIIIDKLKNQKSAWINYTGTGGIAKRAYVEKFTDPETGKKYFVGSSYYPNVESDMTISFVNRAVDYLKEHGVSDSQRVFNSQASDFIQGPLRLFLYDMKGKTLVDTDDPEFIGKNLINLRDPEGKYVVKSILAEAKDNGSGWVSMLDKNEYKELYVQKVIIPDGEFVIGAGFWPASKGNSAMALANKATNHLQNNMIQDAFADFSRLSSEFLRGDLFVSVYDESGITLVYGPYKRFVWSENKKPLSEKGYPIVDHFNATARAGGGWYTYSINGLRYRTFVREVAKESGTNGQGLGKKNDYNGKQARTSSKRSPQTSRYTVAVGYYLD